VAGAAASTATIEAGRHTLDERVGHGRKPVLDHAGGRAHDARFGL
jgi:hypothetical protein